MRVHQTEIEAIFERISLKLGAESSNRGIQMCLPSFKQEYVLLRALRESSKGLNYGELLARMREISREISGDSERFVFGPRSLLSKIDELEDQENIVDQDGYRITSKGKSNLQYLDEVILAR